MEFFDVGALRQELWSERMRSPSELRGGKHLAESLRTIQISYLALFIDKNGMNVFNLWNALFPDASAEIERVRACIEAPWTIIRTFRNKAGFHADAPESFFRARREVLGNASVVNPAIVELERLAKALLRREKDLNDLSGELDRMLNEFEPQSGSRQLRALKQYLLLP